MNRIRCYEVWVKGCERESNTTVNAASPSKARYDYFLTVRDCFADLEFTSVRSRVCGGPRSSKTFLHTAAYRGLPNLRCGDRVKVGEAIGTVVDAGASANFEVIFDDNSPKYPGMKLFVHPDEMKVMERK